MHWKGLRFVADGSSKRHSTLEPQARRSEHLPRPLLSTEPRYSESTGRLQEPGETSAVADGPGPAVESDHGIARADFAGRSTDTSSLRRNRFSFMRLRHASDPQLSQSYAKATQAETPPVPSLPPPTIITTAPTSHERDQPVKQPNKLNLLPSLNLSTEDVSQNLADQPNSETKSEKKNQGSTDSHITGSALSTSQSTPEEPGRLSTTSLRSGGRDQLNDSYRSSVADPRFSESSRSDQSYGDHTFQTNSPRIGPGSTSNSKRFRLPRLKRNRSPLFPLPPKVPSANRVIDKGPQFPPADTPKSDASDEVDRVSPLPSPSRSSVGLSAMGTPQLFRHDSTTSTRSIRSNPSHRGRARSSTMGSLAENQDDLCPVPYLADSGRTSTSTSGRKSFGDIFNITQRLRQNSEPPIPRHGSPGVGGSTTPIRPELPPIPPREEDDTPATYLTRLEETLPRGIIAGVLSQSDDDFFKVGLRKFMRSFSYFGDPIDMCIRKLLMEVELPKETQQIDRFLQAFADRYHECNPGIFASTDQAYFIAFSILILHTDVFNKNNKRKMQKLDYVKNTRGEGVSEEILECFYENISYTPFIKLEDANLRDRHLAKPRRALFKSTSSEHLSRVGREPVDPYTLILDNKLGSLRPSLKDVMDLEDTYNHVGTAGPADMNDLHQAFTKSGILQIVSLRSRPDAFMKTSLDNPLDSNPGLVDIKVAKVGLLWRKDPRKKRARSPWQEWGAVLTFSQLYFFRNMNWVRSLIAQYDAYVKNGRRGTLVFRPPLTEFKPDAIMSTSDAVALLDTSYKKHKHAFMFVRHNALEEVFLATSEPDMNDWIAKLNYAAAFRTTGVRTKGMIATNYEGQRYRSSQRVPSISSLKSDPSEATDKEPRSPTIDTDIVAEFVAARRNLMIQKIQETDEKLSVKQNELEDLLRNGRHLQILTPVHPRAREAVIMAAGRMTARVKWVRQDIWRNKCYREVLLRDLGGDEGTAGEQAGSVADETVSSSGLGRITSVSGPSVKSDPGVRRASSVVRTVSSHGTNDQAPAPVEQPVEKGLLIQPSADEMRRPSIPGSTTSSDTRVGRPLSTGVSPDQGKSFEPSANPLERESSVFSHASRYDGVSLASRASRITAPVSYDEGEERLLREAGLLDLSSSPPPQKQAAAGLDSEADGQAEEATEVSQGDNRPSRVRRSLQRSLRDPHNVHRHHSRGGKKNKGSVSSIGSPVDDESHQEGEGLSRNTPNFTFHGKKASVVTFGSEWQNMPPEERLKLRKPTPNEEPRSSDPAILSNGDEQGMVGHDVDGRPRSFHSTSSLRTDDEPVDFFKDTNEEMPEVSEGPTPHTTVPESALSTEQAQYVTDEPSRSSSLKASDTPIYSSHLTAPTEDKRTSTPSSSLTEHRAVDTPSSENLRQQAVRA